MNFRSIIWTNIQWYSTCFFMIKTNEHFKATTTPSNHIVISTMSYKGIKENPILKLNLFLKLLTFESSYYLVLYGPFSFLSLFLVKWSAKRSATLKKHKKAFRQNVGRLEFTGAGEEIRTLDPRLGKPVLYH